MWRGPVDDEDRLAFGAMSGNHAANFLLHPNLILPSEKKFARSTSSWPKAALKLTSRRRQEAPARITSTGNDERNKTA
jgi:hypothetical protein